MASFTLHGIPVSQAIAIGRAHLMTPAAIGIKHSLLAQEQVEPEVRRLQNAIQLVRQDLSTLREELPQDTPPELSAFIDVHELILSDTMLSELPIQTIRTRYYNAEWAIVTQIEALSAQFDEIDDAYLRERKADIQQVGERVLKALMLGKGSPLLNEIEKKSEDAERIIAVARDISPADMMRFREGVFEGFITDLGGVNAHTAIVARSLNIPAAVGLHNASQLIQQDDVVIIDSMAGVVIVNPSQLILHEYRVLQEKILKERKKLTKLKNTPAVTLDGQSITMMANIELPEDSLAAKQAGADGVGLFRSEFLFLGEDGEFDIMPTEDEQFDAYVRVIKIMRGKMVTIRTLDIGADKPLDKKSTVLNPALGIRAIRYSLSEPQMFLTQLRAILRASGVGPVRLLLPMVSHRFELDQTFTLLEQAKAQLREKNIKYDPHMAIGAMIEVPGAALALPTLIDRLQFISIGTNDLIQYTLAVDRVDNAVSYLYDELHPAILYLLASVIKLGHKSGVTVSVCGEMAGNAQLTRLLLGLGLKEFSVHPSQLLMVKQEILSSNMSDLSGKVKKILKMSNPERIAEAVSLLKVA